MWWGGMAAAVAVAGLLKELERLAALASAWPDDCLKQTLILQPNQQLFLLRRRGAANRGPVANMWTAETLGVVC